MNQDRKNQEVEFESTLGTIITPENPKLVAERGAALREAQLQATISELNAQINQARPTTELKGIPETNDQTSTPPAKLAPVVTIGRTGKVEDSITWLMAVGKRASLKMAA